MYVWTLVCHIMQRSEGKLWELALYTVWVWKSGHQAWWQLLLYTEPSHCPQILSVFLSLTFSLLSF